MKVIATRTEENGSKQAIVMGDRIIQVPFQMPLYSGFDSIPDMFMHIYIYISIYIYIYISRNIGGQSLRAPTGAISQDRGEFF